jgi:hypothetical protein
MHFESMVMVVIFTHDGRVPSFIMFRNSSIVRRKLNDWFATDEYMITRGVPCVAI